MHGLRIKKDVDLESLSKYGFHCYTRKSDEYGLKDKWKFKQYYRCFAHGARLILINDQNREVYFDKWYEDDNRIPKNPKCRYKDLTTIEEVLFDMISDGIVEKVD